MQAAHRMGWIVGPLASCAVGAFGAEPIAHGPLRAADVSASTVTSAGWAGYAVTGDPGSVTAVNGSWVVASANCGGSNPSNAGMSQWIGIDGYTSITVEQVGTDSDCRGGTPSYYAWVEFFPAQGITIRTLDVQAGDVMRAAVTCEGAQFTVTLTDERTQQHFSVSHAVPDAQCNSAEWITEANASLLTDFGTAYFGQRETGQIGTNSATINGRTAFIGNFAAGLTHEIITVGPRGATLSLPSPLSSDGSTFSVQWLAAR